MQSTHYQQSLLQLFHFVPLPWNSHEFLIHFFFGERKLYIRVDFRNKTKAQIEAAETFTSFSYTYAFRCLIALTKLYVIHGENFLLQITDFFNFFFLLSYCLTTHMHKVVEAIGLRNSILLSIMLSSLCIRVSFVSSSSSPNSLTSFLCDVIKGSNLSTRKRSLGLLIPPYPSHDT